jgi:hypothetical protein
VSAAAFAWPAQFKPARGDFDRTGAAHGGNVRAAGADGRERSRDRRAHSPEGRAR